MRRPLFKIISEKEKGEKRGPSTSFSAVVTHCDGSRLPSVSEVLFLISSSLQTAEDEEGFSFCFLLQERSLFHGAVDIQQPLMLISRNNNDRKRRQICSLPSFFPSYAFFFSECLCTVCSTPHLPPWRPVFFPTRGLLLLSCAVPPSYPHCLPEGR